MDAAPGSPREPAAGALPAAAAERPQPPRLDSFHTAAARTAAVPVAGVVAPHLESAARAITSIHDQRHTVGDQANPAPTFNSRGQAHFPGKGSGLRITSELAGPLPHTLTGGLPDPFDRQSPSLHRTRTELLAARRSAMRAPASYDLGGDGAVDQKEYFYATKFDANGDGTLDQEERETASALMKNAATKLVFIPPRGVKFHRNTFSRYSNAVLPGHNVVQVKGAILSEQLEGHAALARAKMPGGGGASGALGERGAHLPPDVAEAVGELMLTGTSGASRCKGVEVDLDMSDNVVNLHLAGARTDFDRVEIKPGYRPELHASGSKLRSELLARRKAARAPTLSYDVDGDGQVSARDFFFSARQDRTGTLALSAEARARAALEEKGAGLGKYFTEIRGDGAGQFGHRVQQREGAILGENSAGGWGALTHSRMHGTNVRIGLDGILKHEGEEEPALTVADVDRLSSSLLDDRNAAGLTINGKVALETVAGAVTDYDGVTVKPQYRPHLLANGSKSVRELRLHRARDKRPDATFDLSGNGGAGAVSCEDYQLSKRFDVGDKGYLTPGELAEAHAALANGLREQFTRLSTGSSRALSSRTFQRADGSVESEGADVVSGEGRGELPYDATVRLPTQGAVPGLDLPLEIASGTGLPSGTRDADAHYSAGSKALTFNASLKAVDRDKHYVSMSCGVVPGVARAVVRYPDGRQEAFGGYAGGQGAGGPTNVTGPAAVDVSADMHRSALGGHTTLGSTGAGAGAGAGSLSPRRAPVSMDATAHSTMPWTSPQPTTSQLTLRPSPNCAPEAPFRTHNQTTFCDPDDRASVHAQAPFALAGVGGTGDGVGAWSEVMEAQRTVAPQLGLRTASQLRAARKARDHDTHAAAHSMPAALAYATLTAAGMPSDPALAPAIAAAAALPGNTLALTQAAAWLGAGSTVAGAVALAGMGGAPVTEGDLSASQHAYAPTSTLPPHGATLKDQRDATMTLPSGSPVVLDRTSRGCYEGGLTGLSTAKADAAMPPALCAHIAAAAAVARTVALGAPGSPLRPAHAPVTATLPAYLARSMHSSSALAVDPQELPSDLTKPGALDESVRHLQANTRTALTALRKQQAYAAARGDFEARDDTGRGAGAEPALPSLYAPHFNDSSFESAGKAVVLPGAGEGAPLSKTRSALKQRLLATAITEALPGAPTGPSSIHPAPLPSFAARLNSTLTPWYTDRAALHVPLDASLEDLTPARGVAGGAPSYTSVVSALDGAAPAEDPVLAALPGNYHGVAREYDAALRHTVRAPGLAGAAAVSAEELRETQAPRVTLAPAAVGAKNPRLIVDGLAREEECVDAAGGAFDKVREVRPCDLGPWVRRRDVGIARKVTEVDPQAPSEAAAAAASNVSVAPGSPAGGGGSGFCGRGSPSTNAMDPALPRLYELHPNVSSLGTGLPGAPPWDGDATVRAQLSANPFRLNDNGGNWAVAQLEHRARVEGEAPHTLDGEGKAAVSPRDIRPLYSSFTSDRAFMLPYVTPRGLPLQPRSPSRNDLSAAVALAGGSVRPGARVTVFKALPSQGVPGPENPISLRAALPGDVERRRGSTYGVEVVEGGAPGGRDVTVRGASRDKWGEDGASARTLRSADVMQAGSGGGGEGGGASGRGGAAAGAQSPRQGMAKPSSAPSRPAAVRGSLQASAEGGAYSGVRTGGFRE